jgi:hypothetical protein
MSWYAAHVVMYIKLKSGRQFEYPIWENIVLVDADSDEAAIEKAARIGRESEGDSSGTLRWNDAAASLVFAGVRKVIRCQEPEEPPTDGKEVSYSQMYVDSEQSIQDLANGLPVHVLYEE